jgi:hypothetical protein
MFLKVMFPLSGFNHGDFIQVEVGKLMASWFVLAEKPPLIALFGVL